MKNNQINLAYMLPKNFQVNYIKMEMKSVSDCLNFIDHVILCVAENFNGVESLEVVRDYMIEMYNDEYIENMIVMTGVLSQINLIIETIYDIDDDSDFKRKYWILRKHILAWLEENNTKPKVNVNNEE